MADNYHISTIQSVPSESMAELQQAAGRAAKGIRSAEEMRKACERMDRMREENRKIFGVQNVAVELIRDARQ
jgi:hypothetical protein